MLTLHTLLPLPEKAPFLRINFAVKNPPGRHKTVRPPLSAVNNADSTDPSDDETAISVKMVRSSDFLNSSDMAGRSPFISHRGYEYMLISVFRSYIHVELLKNRTAAELVRAYRATYDFYLALGFSPTVQMLDNETGKELAHFFTTVHVKPEYVPPTTTAETERNEPFRTGKDTLFPACVTSIQIFRCFSGANWSYKLN